MITSRISRLRARPNNNRKLDRRPTRSVAPRIAESYCVAPCIRHPWDLRQAQFGNVFGVVMEQAGPAGMQIVADGRRKVFSPNRILPSLID
jgi:hypothetical protein